MTMLNQPVKSLNVATLPKDAFESPLVERALKDSANAPTPSDDEIAGAIGALSESYNLIRYIEVNGGPSLSEEAREHAESNFERAQLHLIRVLVLRDKAAHPAKP